MAEKKTPVRPVQVTYECDVEGCDGEMQPEAVTLLVTDWSTPTKTPHRCCKCNVQQIFATSYPTLRFEPVEEGGPA
jgi:hypothetical protein